MEAVFRIVYDVRSVVVPVDHAEIEASLANAFVASFATHPPQYLSTTTTD
jgi:hypothetical protein